MVIIAEKHINIKNVPVILTPECLDFISIIHDKFSFELSKKNAKILNFRNDTKHIRDLKWHIDKLPDYLYCRHVEITGPASNAKMMINAINSNADGYMADLEDSMSPTFENVINAHINIRSAIRNSLTYKTEKKIYKINLKINYMFVRSRGTHLKEEGLYDNIPVNAALFDISVYMFHNAKFLIDNNKHPLLYIPKLETYEQAVLINKMLNEIETILKIPIGSTKVTLLIETYPAIFQLDEIMYALKDYICAVNCGRWDYMFSIIKCIGDKVEFGDRSKLSMELPLMKAYVKQVVSRAHCRSVLALGGMSAFIPVLDEKKNINILNKIFIDKKLEISQGCDGAWVAHPKLIMPIKKLFIYLLKKNNQLDIIHNDTIEVDAGIFTDLGDNRQTFSLQSAHQNINTCLLYIDSWLNGNGAVNINGLMEDLATSEICAHQLRQWCNHNLSGLSRKNLKEHIEYVVQNADISKKQISPIVQKLLHKYVLGNYDFFPDIAAPFLRYKNGFSGYKFNKKTLDTLLGSKPFMTGIELTKYRGEFLNNYLFKLNKPAYKFLGTTNGVSAVNVVAGGKGSVGPYIGGWQINAMKNRLQMLLPDTLHVSPEEPGDCAIEINNHLLRADRIQYLTTKNEDNVEYYDMALLADLEQGWSTPEKTRIAVKNAILNGINVIHIEDQGPKKRCGHLGDKELDTFENYLIIMKSANLAAQEILGKQQVTKQWVRFVARTDAFSAKRIVGSENLRSPENPEYKFIDWGKGTSSDGCYFYLKQGINKDTGNKWGLDLAIERSARIVDSGLASHVWMETPDADLNVAKKFLDGVNEILFLKNKQAFGLYNHSPSFDWDVKFYKEAEILSDILIKKFNDNFEKINIDNVKEFYTNTGSKINGDHLINLSSIKEIYFCLSTKDSNKNLVNIIVEERLKAFGKMLSSFGYNLHLITLPEFHITAFNMFNLSNNFSHQGINAFVKHTQRLERILTENNKKYTYYKHQTATGTGIEANFSKAVGSSNVNILEHSTEQDDLNKRKET